MNLPDKIKRLIDNHNDDEAIKEITDLIRREGDDASLYIERGKLYWRTGQRRLAMQDYITAAELNPDGPGKEYVKMTQDIMAFYDKNRYNP